MATLFSPSRRGFLGAAMGGGFLAMAGPLSAAELFPVVETTNGRLRGMMAGGIAKFLGVRYGAPTSGANRFMPPQPVEKWAGIRSALHYSDTAPQVPGDRRHDYADLIMFENQPSGPGEDNLALNLWSPTLSNTAKNPVIVVLHGGGFYGGSGNAIGMDGEAMARFSDSVVIAINHRLGAPVRQMAMGHPPGRALPHLLHRGQELLIRLGPGHLIQQKFHCFHRRQRIEHLTQYPDPVEILRVQQQLLFPRAATLDLDGRIYPLLGQLALEVELHVPRALELFVDDVVHPAARIN